MRSFPNCTSKKRLGHNFFFFPKKSHTFILKLFNYSSFIFSSRLLTVETHQGPIQSCFFSLRQNNGGKKTVFWIGATNFNFVLAKTHREIHPKDSVKTKMRVYWNNIESMHDRVKEWSENLLYIQSLWFKTYF